MWRRCLVERAPDIGRLLQGPQDEDMADDEAGSGMLSPGKSTY